MKHNARNINRCLVFIGETETDSSLFSVEVGNHCVRKGTKQCQLCPFRRLEVNAGDTQLPACPISK